VARGFAVGTINANLHAIGMSFFSMKLNNMITMMGKKHIIINMKKVDFYVDLLIKKIGTRLLISYAYYTDKTVLHFLTCEA
jgi:hypothetical protein